MSAEEKENKGSVHRFEQVVPQEDLTVEEDRDVPGWEELSLEDSFDDLARALAGGLSRREVLRQIGSVFVASLVALLAPGRARADPPPGRGRCLPPMTRCIGREGRGLCVDLSSDRNNCGACGNVCDSPEDLCCNGVCTNVVFDRFNCGACGNVCPEGSDCCGGVCTPLNTEENCGCCGCGCLPDEQCVDGFCVPV